MKPKRILTILLTFAMLFAILPGNIAFAAKVSNSTYGITIDKVEHVKCGDHNHTIKSVALETGTPSNGNVTFDLKITLTKNDSCISNPVTISYTADITCDSSYTKTGENSTNSAGQRISGGFTVTKTKKNHNWSNGSCTICKVEHDNHTWSNGTCTVCQGTHSNHSWENGTCTICQATHADHSWSNGSCSVCKIEHDSHTWSNGTCTICQGTHSNHSWENGTCTVCQGTHTNHSWSNGICSVCKIAHDNHYWSKGACSICHLAHSDHDWEYGQCTVCGLNCGHKWTKDGCSVCGITCSHSYSGYRCTKCGYSLFGYTDRVWNSETNKLDITKKDINDLTTLVTNNTSVMSNGWYVVQGDVTIGGHCYVYGTVHLLLCDGATLNCKRGLSVSSGNTLYIYTQSSDIDKMGKLNATAPQGYAGIGGYNLGGCYDNGNVTINGGIITAKGGDYGAGIGGGGGEFLGGDGGNVTINGGVITANGGRHSAGIGGARDGDNGNVTINGGSVTAKGGDWAAGIGGGYNGKYGKTVINGGNVKAIAGYRVPFAIGDGENSHNSTVKQGTVKNSKGNNLSLKTYTLVGNRTQKKINSIEGLDYGDSDVYTFDGDKLYMYLPSGAGNITKVTMQYGQVFTPKNEGDTTLYCNHNYFNGYCKYCEEWVTNYKPEMENGAYQISRPSELTWFIEQVNSGNTGINAVLTNDIDDEVKQGIGTITKPYTGTFDGNGHTIKVELGSWQYSSLFPCVNGATIKNLRVDGSVTTSEQNASGLVSCASGGNVRIENCISTVKINSAVSGDGTHGGLVALASGGNLTIESSAFIGKISGENTTNCGGLVGWAGTSCNISNSYVTAEFSINDENDSSNTIARNSAKANISNCYYINSLGEVPGGTEQIESKELASGKLAYKINDAAGVARWYQNLTNGKTVDAYPVPFDSHGAVYYCYLSCESDNIGYTNKLKTVNGHNGEEENCLKPAICVDCGETYKEIDSTKHATDETYYKLIDNEKHGKYNSCCNALIEEEEHSGTTADCLNNSHCDVCNTSYGDKNDGTHTGTQVWVDTGNGTHENKYTCCGAVTETEKHNLTITADDETDTITVVCDTCNGNGTVTLQADGKEYDGNVLDIKTETTGFMNNWNKPAEISVNYCCEGGCKTAGEHTITMTVGDKTVTKTVNITKKTLTIAEIKAFSKSYDATGAVTVNSIPLQGIVVYQKGDYSVFDIKDNVAIDLSKAVVTTESGDTGSYTEANVSNITLIGSDKDNYSIDSSVGGVTLSNTYGGEYQIYQIQVWIKPLDQTLYGEEAEINQTAYTVEGLDEELYTLSGIVLSEANGKITVDGTGVKITLKDTETDVTKHFDIATSYTANVLHYCENHTFNDNGFCAIGDCDSYEQATLNDNGTEDNQWDDYYEIENAGQLYWFAKQVNDYGNYNISAKLTADIKVNDDPTATDAREWTPIANDGYNRFSGKFVGNGHTISGLYCKNTDGYVGLFGRLSYIYVTDLHIKNSYFEGKNAGAFAGGSEGYLERCSVGTDVTVVGTDFIGGMVGNASDGSLTDCYSIANISGGVWGGLVGYSCAYIKNCCTNAMQPVGEVNKSYGGRFENVYYAKDTRDYSDGNDGTFTYKQTFEGATEVEDFASGEVAYKLQSEVKGEIISYDENNGWEPIYGEAPQIWGQNIGTDKYPTFSNAKVYEDTYNGEKLYRNEIDGNKIFSLGADKKSATVFLNKAGTYTIVFADYEDSQLANLKTFEVTVDKAQAVRVVSDKDFTLGTGDKIMLWNNFVNLTPMCEAYEVK